MSPLPKRMEIELTETDVENNLVKILESMNRLRHEALADEKKDPEKCDEYLHLAHRLASSLEGLANDVLVEKMQEVVQYMNKDERLLRYDPLQDGYWEKKHPDFDNRLEEILIRFMKDDFSSVDDKHHILQGIKFLGIKGEENFDEQQKVINTILPYHDAIDVDKPGFFERILARLFGESHDAEKEAGLELKIKNNSQIPDHIYEKAKDMGYKTVIANIDNKDRAGLDSKYPDVSTIGDVDEPDDEGLMIKIGDFLEKTKIAYPLLGALPAKWQYKLSNATGYDWHIGMGTSFFTEALLGATATISTIYSFGNALPLLYVTVPVIADLIGRMIGGSYSFDEYGDSWSSACGSAFFKIPLYPFEKLYDSIKGKGFRNGENVKITLHDIVEKQHFNAFEFFEKLASVPFSKDAEKSLEYRMNNHHTFALEANKELQDLQDCNAGRFSKLEKEIRFVLSKYGVDTGQANINSSAEFADFEEYVKKKMEKFMRDFVKKIREDSSNIRGSRCRFKNRKQDTISEGEIYDYVQSLQYFRMKIDAGDYYADVNIGPIGSEIVEYLSGPAIFFAYKQGSHTYKDAVDKLYDDLFKEMKEESEKEKIAFPKPDVDVSISEDKKNSFLIYETSNDVDEFVKTTKMFLGKGDNKYVISYITTGKPSDDFINELLRKEISAAEKLETIAKKVKSHYAHLVTWDDSEKVELSALP